MTEEPYTGMVIQIETLFPIACHSPVIPTTVWMVRQTCLPEIGVGVIGPGAKMPEL
jgi:hypothetical protein